VLKVCKYHKGQNWPNSNKNSTNTLRQEVVCSIYQDLMPASCLQNHFNAIQTPNTFVNRNFVSYNLRIFTRIFWANISRKIRIFSLGRKKKITLFLKKSVHHEMYALAVKRFPTLLDRGKYHIAFKCLLTILST